MAFCSNNLFEVFSQLLVKAICKFECTCKSLSKLTEETLFTKKQIQNSLIIWTTRVTLFKRILVKGTKKSSSGVSKDVMRFLSESTRILASMKGLILYRTKRKTPVELFICNPATESWLPIPLPKQIQERPYADITTMLLQCSNANDDYMLFHVEWPTDLRSLNNYGNIYNPKEGEWKAMEKSFFAGGRFMQFNMPVHCNGCIHFISEFSPYLKTSLYFTPYLMSYNLENGSSKMLRLPKDARWGVHNLDCDMGIFSWGKSSICLVRLRKSVFTIWILTDYESNRWRRILNVRTKEMGLKEKYPKITSFTVMNDNLLTFATETRIYTCGLSDENYMRVEEICQCTLNVCFTSYLDSLRDCGPGVASLPY